MEVLQKVARALADKWDVKVVQRGGKAYTDGKTIVIPALPENINSHDLAMARGYVGHERGHISFTDFDAARKEIGEDKVLHKVWNFIEDLIIERKVAQEYAGERVNLNYLANEILKTSDINHPLTWLFAEGRRRICGYDIPEVPDMSGDLKATFGTDIFDQLERVETTKQAIDLARLLIRRYNMPNQEQASDNGNSQNKGQKQGKGQEQGKGNDGDNDKAQGNDKSQDGSDGDDGGSGSDGNDSSEGASGGDGSKGDSDGGSGGKGSEGDGDSGSRSGDSDKEDGDGSKAKSSGGGGHGAGGSQGVHQNLGDAEDPYETARRHLEKIHNMHLGRNEYMVYDKSHDRFNPMPKAHDIDKYEQLKKSLGQFNAVRGRIQNVFMARTQSRWHGGQTEGRVNPKALARVPMGYQDVFRKKSHCIDRDTAISFLVDFSGSMRGRKLTAAMQSVVLMLECFVGTTIKTEVLTYTTTGVEGLRGEINRAFKKGEIYIGQYGRVEPLEMRVIKTFDEPYGLAVKQKISGFTEVELNNTPGGDSVLIAYNRLVQRKEERKVLIVLTDGVVGTAYANAGVERAYLKQVNDDIKKAGRVEAICFALEFGSCNQYFHNVIDISKAQDLPSYIFNELRRIMKV